jgi:predicted phosphoribosyltransferase
MDMKTDYVYFANRKEAGRQLAERIPESLRRLDPLILALPRGGVPVAAEIAKALGRPLDVLIVRKLGVPGHEEYAMGALASGGVTVLNQETVSSLRLSAAQVDAAIERETRELVRREKLYRGGKPPPVVTGHTVILVDDGIATGSTVQAAIQLLYQQGAGRVVVAAPVAPPDTVERLREKADEVIILSEPEPFGGVGRWYRDFSQTSDEEVRSLLAECPRTHPPIKRNSVTT